MGARISQHVGASSTSTRPASSPMRGKIVPLEGQDPVAAPALADFASSRLLAVLPHARPGFGEERRYALPTTLLGKRLAPHELRAELSLRVAERSFPREASCRRETRSASTLPSTSSSRILRATTIDQALNPASGSRSAGLSAGTNRCTSVVRLPGGAVRTTRRGPDTAASVWMHDPSLGHSRPRFRLPLSGPSAPRAYRSAPSPHNIGSPPSPGYRMDVRERSRVAVVYARNLTR